MRIARKHIQLLKVQVVTSYPEHLHYLIPQVIDDLGNSPRHFSIPKAKPGCIVVHQGLVADPAPISTGPPGIALEA